MIILKMIIPVGLILLGVGGIINRIISKIKCTEYVRATVVSVDKKFDFDDNTDTYYPIYSYTYEGQKYTNRTNMGRSSSDLEAGDEVELFIDPNDPYRLYYPKETVSRVIIYLALIGVGAFFMYIVI